MSNGTEPIFNTSEQAVLEEVSRSLRDRGWAGHATVEWLLRAWRKLSVSIDGYSMTVDDYTNDLTARDGLEIVLAECTDPLRTKLRLHIEKVDKEFLARTVEDVEHNLERYFRIDEASAWWWRRRPAAGPLAEILAKPSSA